MPLTKVLLKIFAWRFYREHSGMLLFFFVTIISYCLFIKTAGIYRAEESVFYHLMLVMAFIITPVIMLMVFAFWLVYTIKSWQFVSKQLLLENNRFLFYSITSCNKFNQFKSWFCVQLAISLPFIGYWVLATVLGVIYNANLIPAITLAYILFMAAVSSFLYVFLVNRISKTPRPSFLIRLSKNWGKPFSSLFLYHLFNRLKFAYVLTKLFSWFTITGIFFLFSDYATDNRVAAITMLGIVTLHGFLIYKEHHFKETYLSFSRNLPYSRFVLFFNFSATYFLLILPESIWLLSKFPLIVAVKVLLFGLCIALLLRSLVYVTGLKTYRYLLWIFCLFVGLFYIIMFGWFWLLLVAALVISFAIFYVNYYKPKAIIKF